MERQTDRRIEKGEADRQTDREGRGRQTDGKRRERQTDRRIEKGEAEQMLMMLITCVGNLQAENEGEINHKENASTSLFLQADCAGGGTPCESPPIFHNPSSYWRFSTSI